MTTFILTSERFSLYFLWYYLSTSIENTELGLLFNRVVIVVFRNGRSVGDLSQGRKNTLTHGSPLCFGIGLKGYLPVTGTRLEREDTKV